MKMQDQIDEWIKEIKNEIERNGNSQYSKKEIRR